ncbi:MULTISPECIES: DUF397 domain-containing protein [Streptomyces]|uniref:DUF397 domain-containing protein n=1 Tax=Streptomyces TaxID=1883 RepID=UPI0027E359BF|nr:DUF397 domain-containing protein [Streptomyces lincolnensis]MCD7438681.1 DUF397 domain-containing protein [Streptomyces lincolnensis]
MTDLTWQKSTYSEEGSACVYLAATPTGPILLRESDEPEILLTTLPRQISALISALKSADDFERATSRQPISTDFPHFHPRQHTGEKSEIFH